MLEKQLLIAKAELVGHKAKHCHGSQKTKLLFKRDELINKANNLWRKK